MGKTCINKRTGRRCRNFEEAEREYQEAQSAWEENQSNKAAWDKMFLLVQAAVFNNLNKDLEHKLDREEIEGRALDITMNIMRSILNKRAQGLPWKIGKVSSAVHLPCMARYDKKLQFYDKCITFTRLESMNQPLNIENETDVFDGLDYDYAQGYGFICMRGSPEEWKPYEDDEDFYYNDEDEYGE